MGHDSCRCNSKQSRFGSVVPATAVTHGGLPLTTMVHHCSRLILLKFETIIYFPKSIKIKLEKIKSIM